MSTSQPPARGGASLDHASIIAESARLLRSGRGLAEHVPAILDHLGTSLALSRAYLFEVHEVAHAGLGQTCRFDWAAPGLAPLSTDARNIDETIPADDPLFLDWGRRRRRGEMISGHTRDLTGYLRADFELQRIKSFVSMPIMVNGRWWGHIGFDDCEREREWSSSEISVLETIAFLLGNAIELSASSLVMSEATRVALLKSAPDAMVVVDEDACILEFNPAAEAMFALHSADVLGRPVREVIVPPAYREAHAAGFKRYLSGAPSRIVGQRLEIEALRSDGTTLPVEITVTEIRVEARRLFFAHIRDLTARKAAEAEAVRQREALHQSEKMTALGSLLSGIAHELNNPLAVVVGRAIMLEEQASDPEMVEGLAQLRHAAERCAKISRTFLAMARQSAPKRSRASLNALVDSALELTGYSLRSAGIAIEQELDPGLPDVFVEQDQIVQVLMNLIINAQQAMAETTGRAG